MPTNELTTSREALIKAEAVLAELLAQKAEKEKRHGTLAGERKALAYAAATGDKNAATKQARLNTEGTTLALEIENLANAITDADAHVATAREALARAEHRQKAIDTRFRLLKYAEIGKSLDHHAAELVEAMNAFAAEADAIRRLGMGGPGHELMVANLKRAWLTAFGTDRLREGFGVGIAQPSQKTSFATLVAEWSQRIDANVQAALAAE